MMTQYKPKTIIIWRISDGRSGHNTQSRGLVNALEKLTPCVCHDIEAMALKSGLAQYLLKQYRPGNDLPDPNLIIGAGHGTHLSLLCAQHARGGRTVVIMKPSLPFGWFDYCLIPEHDNPPDDKHTLVTRGAINMVTASKQHQDNQGLMLIGGPSKHFCWDSGAILKQIKTILERTAHVSWKISDSPRTPENMCDALARLHYPNAHFMPHKTTGPDWVASQLATAGNVWVSEDSISMIYESLTSGAATGILHVPVKKQGKINHDIQTLNDNGMITTFEAWQNGALLSPPAEMLNEAARAAKYLLEIYH
ncbi:MAG: hypothetical protein HW411_1100 [Gammaproteobacteria bacterium]|nr:hypothetical protein [Gammaproteobacteria bacterium]